MPFPTKRSTNTSDFGDSARFGGADINAVLDYTFTAVSNIAYSFIIWKSGSTYYARDCITGDISSNATFATLINATITTLNTAGGGIIFLKAGVYSLTAQISLANRSNIYLQGEGKDITIIRCTTAGIYMLIKNDATATSNIIIKDMTIDGNNISSQVLNLVQNTNGVLLQDAKFTKGNSADGLQVNLDVNDATLIDCDFTAANTSGDICALGIANFALIEGCTFSRTVSGGGLTFGDGNNVKIIGNHFINCVTYGAISLENLAGDYHNIVIDGNTFQNISAGDSIHSTDVGGSGNTLDNVTISNNVFIDSGGIQLVKYFTNLNIVNNQFIRSCTDTLGAISVQAPQFCNITGNIINGKLAGTAPLAGILILQDTPEGKYINISNNQIYSFEKHGINVRDIKNFQIQNNQIRDCCGLTDNVYSGIFCESWSDKCSIGLIRGNMITSGLTNNMLCGILLDDTAIAGDNISIIDNHLSDAQTANIYAVAATGLVVKRNVGFKTENSGTATIASGQTTIVVNHGLAITPSINDIHVTPKNSMGSATKFFVSTVTSTQFTINVNVDPGATTAIFAWTIV